MVHLPIPYADRDAYRQTKHPDTTPNNTLPPKQALFALNGIYFPVLRTTISRVFGEAQFGAALGAVATMQQVTNTVAPSAFSLLYSQTVSLNITVPHVIDSHFGTMTSTIISPSLAACVRQRCRSRDPACHLR